MAKLIHMYAILFFLLVAIKRNLLSLLSINITSPLVFSFWIVDFGLSG